jgi:hypothetical protein
MRGSRSRRYESAQHERAHLNTDFEAAIERYEALTREAVRQRFELPERGTRIALLGSVTIIAGSERESGTLRNVRATFIVDSLAEYDAHLRATATTLQSPSPTPAGHTPDCSRRRGCGV